MRVAFIQYTTPAAYPPVMNASTILAEKDFEVSLWGVGGQGQSSKLTMPLGRNMSQWTLPYCPPGLRQKAHYLRFVAGCLTKTFFQGQKVIYVSDMWAYPIGWLASLIPGVRVIAHEHDTPPAGGKGIIRALQMFRCRLFRRAMVTVIPQEQRARLVESSVHPRKVQVVWNCPRLAELQAVRKPSAGDPIYLWYHGSITSGQLPETVIRALPLLPSHFKLRFAGYETIGQQGYVATLLKLAHELSVGDRVEYVGTTPTRSELFDRASQCEIGLALFSRSFREAMVGASNKPFDYLSCGLALLINDTEEWTEFFRNCPAAKSCNPGDPASIANAILDISRDRSALQSRRERGQAMMRQLWNYETQFAPVLSMIETLAGRSEKAAARGAAASVKK